MRPQLFKANRDAPHPVLIFRDGSRHIHLIDDTERVLALNYPDSRYLRQLKR